MTAGRRPRCAHSAPQLWHWTRLLTAPLLAAPRCRRRLRQQLLRWCGGTPLPAWLPQRCTAPLPPSSVAAQGHQCCWQRAAMMTTAWNEQALLPWTPRHHREPSSVPSTRPAGCRWTHQKQRRLRPARPPPRRRRHRRGPSPSPHPLLASRWPSLHRQRGRARHEPIIMQALCYWRDCARTVCTHPSARRTPLPNVARIPQSCGTGARRPPRAAIWSQGSTEEDEGGRCGRHD